MFMVKEKKGEDTEGDDSEGQRVKGATTGRRGLFDGGHLAQRDDLQRMNRKVAQLASSEEIRIKKSGSRLFREIHTSTSTTCLSMS